MDRRTFLKRTGFGAGGAAVATLAAPAIAQGTMELKMVMPWPKNFPGLGTSAQRVAERIKAMSGGRISVTTYAANELVPALQEFDAVSQGTADLYHSPDYYFAGKHAAFNYFTAAPLGLTATEHTAWIELLGGQALWDELSSGFKIKPLLVGNTGTQMAGWFKKPIEKADDMRGLNFRMPGLGGQVWRGLGMNIVSLAPPEIFTALSSGAIDGTDWVGPWNDLAFGFYKAASYYYYPSMVEGGAALTLGVNLDVWNKLSASDQELLKAAALTENGMMYAEYTANSGTALTTLVNDHGVKVSRFPDDIIDEIGKIAPDVLASVATDDIGKRVYESYIKARDSMRNWTSIAEPQFIGARERILNKA